jgi:hypothetical protein
MCLHSFVILKIVMMYGLLQQFRYFSSPILQQILVDESLLFTSFEALFGINALLWRLLFARGAREILEKHLKKEELAESKVYVEVRKHVR